MRIRLFCLLGAVAMFVGTAAPVNAATIRFDNIVATWSDANPAANVTYYNNGLSNPSARWGNGAGNATPIDQGSGYDFVAATPLPVDVAMPPNPSAAFDLGTFTHVNQPITSGTSITDIRLSMTTDISIDVGSGFIAQGSRTFVFDFEHLESPNSDNPCADTNPNGAGVNVNGCADRVTFGYNDLSDSFTINGVLYTVQLFGFVYNNQTAPSFWTTEIADNHAVLQGIVIERENVPEPAVLLLLGIGLVGMGVSARRRA